MNPSSGTTLTPEEFAGAFPFHVAFDRAWRVAGYGRNLPRLCPGLTAGEPAGEWLRLVRPEIAFDWEPVQANAGTLFLVECRGSGVVLRGQMLPRPSADRILFLGSPWFTRADQVVAAGLGLNDFAIHDPGMDLLLMMQAQSTALGELKDLMTRLTRQREELRQANRRLQSQNAELEAAQAAIRRSEAEARLLGLVAARTENGVVITDANGRTLWVNAGFTRITGYSLDDLRGRKPGEVLQGPDTDPSTIEFMRRHLREQRGFHTEVLNYHRTGRPIWISVEVQPVRNDPGEVTHFLAIESDITERRAAELRLRQTASRLSALVCNLEEGIVVEDEHRRIVLVNDQFCRMFGLPVAADAMLGVDCAAAARDSAASFADPAGFLRRVEELLSHRQKATGEDVALADGRVFERDYVPIFLGETYGGHLWAYRDVTARRRAEETLRAETELLNNTLDGIVDGVVVVDPECRVRLLNPEAEKLTGWIPELATGRPVSDILRLTDESGEPVENPLEESFRQRRPVGDIHRTDQRFVLRGLDGRPRPVVLGARPMLRDQQVVGGLVVFRDVAAELEAEQMKRDFVYSVSHELRTPLTSIRGFLSTLLTDPGMDAETRTEFLRIVDDQAHRLSRLVEDILDLSRIESGQTRLESEPVDLRQLARNCIEEILPIACRKSLRVEIDLPDDLPPFPGDRERLRSIFGNLLGNAVKFTPDHGAIGLALVRTRGHLEGVVWDTGEGIAPDHLDRIFEKFYRVHRSRHPVAGTGLGLSIVRSLVERMAGTIEVESELDRGSRFRFRLPWRDPDTPPDVRDDRDDHA